MTNEEFEQLISTYNNYLNKMSEALEHLNENIVDNSFQEVGMVLPAIADGLEWLNEAISGFVTFGKIDPYNYGKFQELMSSLLEALENKDLSLLHDLCEYEILPLLNELKIDVTKFTCQG